MALNNREFLISLRQSILALAAKALILIFSSLTLPRTLNSAPRKPPGLTPARGHSEARTSSREKATQDKHLARSKLEHGCQYRAIFIRKAKPKAADNPEEVHNSKVFWAGDRQSIRHLADDENWRGTITEISLAVWEFARAAACYRIPEAATLAKTTTG